MKIEVKGINVLISDVRKYPERVVKAIQEETKDWSDRTAEKAQIDCPVDTGALKNSIRAVVGSDKLTFIVKAGGINGVDYAPYVEFGTGAYVDQGFLQEYGLVNYALQFKGAGVRQVNLPARSFLYRNARTEFEKSVRNIQEIIKNAWNK